MIGAFGRLDADDGFGGWEGVGVAMLDDRSGDAVGMVYCVANATLDIAIKLGLLLRAAQEASGGDNVSDAARDRKHKNIQELV